jgi:hypothetical protein
MPSEPSAGESKLVVYRAGTYLRVFSTSTGQWHAHTPSAGTTPVLLGDILMVPESDRWTAMSAQRGVFEPLILGTSVPLSPLSTSRFAFLRVGNTVHYFAAAIGSWRSRTLPANWTVEAFGADEQLLVFTGPNPTPLSPGFAGCELYDTFADAWYSLPPRSGVTVVRSGFSQNAGFILMHGPGQSVAATFTNSQPGWNIRTPNVLTVDGNSAPGGGDLFTGFNITYSGATDTLTESIPPYFLFSRGLLSLGYASQTLSYIALGINGQSYVTLPPGATTVEHYLGFRPQGVRVFAFGTQSFAFNGLDGSVDYVACNQGPWPAGSAYHGVLVGAAVDASTGVVSVYSAPLSQWVSLPASALPESGTIRAGDASVLLSTSNGITAFSGRTGAFVPLVGAGISRWNGFAASSPTAVHAFDAATDRWLSASIADATVAHNHSGFIAASQNRAVGFGAASAHLESLDVAELLVSPQTLDGGGFVRTATRIFGFRGVPTTRTGATFPMSALGNAPGSPFRGQTVIGEGSIALLALSGAAQAPTQLPPFGELWLDPATAVPFGLISPPPGELRVRSSFLIPNLPTLRGTQWALQSLVLPPQGQPYLSSVTRLSIL